MKTIHSRIVINSFRSRRDGSLGFSGETPELTVEERVHFMEIQGMEIDTLLKPVDGSSDIVEIKTEVNSKTPSQRLRSTLFVLWTQQGSVGDFMSYYNDQMEKFINLVKSKLE